jgi:hypothetical protein
LDELNTMLAKSGPLSRPSILWEIKKLSSG